MVGLERLLIGRTLGGRYAVEELIGRGRGGLVYRARDTEAGEEVALKVVAAPQSAEARERYRRVLAGEVRAAAALRHPNLVAVHALGHDPELDLDYVTAELARGQTLASVLAQRGKPPISLGLRLLGDAADGLAAGHRAGLVHRDVRPASLYMVRSEAERQVRVKVAGFGIPQLVRRESLATAPPEVAAYASPELLAAGSARLTPASDVFSLGVIGYELMTGALPLDEDARRALAEGRPVEIQGPAEAPAGVPPHVLEAVLNALRISPAERFADASGFAEALREPSSRPVAVPAAIAEPSVPAAPPVVESSVPAAAPLVLESTLPVIAPLAVEAAAATVVEAAQEPAAAAPVVSPDVVVAAPVASAATTVEPDAVPMMEPEAAPVVSAAPVPPAIPPTHGAPLPRAVPADLDLYYPPRPMATPATVSHPAELAAAPVATHTHIPEVAPVAAAVPIVETPRVVETPVVAASEVVAPPVLASTPAPTAAPIAASRPLSMGRTKPAGGGRRFRPSMAAGFVLGMLVLGTVGWIATRHPSGADAASTQKLAANAVAPAAPGAATPAAAVAGEEPRTDAARPAADSASKSPEARRREEARKRQLDEARAQQQEADRARLAQQQAAAQAQPQTQPAAAPPPPAVRLAAVTPPAQQPIAVAPRPSAPPPPAPPAREEPAPTREAAPSNGIFDITDVEVRPRLRNSAEIQRSLQSRYPEALQSARVSGSVVASFVVNPDGSVDASTVHIVSSPHAAFNVPTQSVLRRARFQPATVRGQAVRVQVTMPVQWTAP